MDIAYRKESEAVAARTSDAVPASHLSARLCLQNAAPRRSQATNLELAEADQRNKTKVRSLWTKAQALVRDLFSTPSNQGLKPTPGVSIILTPVGLLVYQWQIDTAQQP
jgi:hypothetical protein